MRRARDDNGGIEIAESAEAGIAVKEEEEEDGGENTDNISTAMKTVPQQQQPAQDGEEEIIAEQEEEEGGKPDVLQVVIGKPYASPLPPMEFWIETFLIAAQSVVLAFFSLGYLNVTYIIPELWFSMGGNSDYPSDPSTTTFLAGEPFWILIGAATGLVVGVVKAFVFQFDTYDGFIEDLLELGEGTRPWDSAKVTLTCLLSLAGGASLGPESGLGSACCGLSVLYVRFIVNPCCRWAKTKFNKNNDNNNNNDESSTPAAPDVAEEEKRRSKLVVLCGMVAAFATILPTPVSAILLCIELPGFDVLVDRHGLPYIRTVAQLAVAGTMSFFLFDLFYGNTYLPSEHIIPGFLHRYQQSDIPLAMAIGAMGAVLAVAYFLIGGIVKAIANKSKSALDAKFNGNNKYRILILCVVGGTLYGVLGYIFPLTLGDGSYQISTVIGIEGRSISTSVLVASGFAKMLTYWISNEFGFVGGLFYPLLLASSIGGRVIENEFGTPWATTMACSLVAIPAAFCPLPFSLMILATNMFNMSSRGSIPPFVSIVTAHILFTGVGIPQKLLSFAQKK